MDLKGPNNITFPNYPLPLIYLKALDNDLKHGSDFGKQDSVKSQELRL